MPYGSRMYLRNRFSSCSGKPEDVEAQLGELLAHRLLVEDADDRVFAVHARHHRDAEVDGLARHAQAEAAVLRHALLGDVELGHDLDARQDRAVKPLGDRPHRRLQHAVDAVLHIHRIVLRLDVNVARAPLDRREDGRVDEADDRAAVARQALDGEVVLARFVVLEHLDLEFFGGLVEHALRAFALLQHALDRRPRADHDAHVGAEDHRQLVDHRQVRRIRHDDDERLAVAAVRHEAVAQHQVRRNRSEQLLIDPELVHVEELEPIALGQPPRRRLFGAALLGRHFGRVFDQRFGVERALGSHIHYRFPITDESWNSGRYSASTMPAITTPMTTSIAGSITVTKRADFGLDFLVVKVREAVQHFRQRAGGLADFNHLDAHIGHGLALEERVGEALPFANACGATISSSLPM